jgi:hypothetical protein
MPTAPEEKSLDFQVDAIFVLMQREMGLKEISYRKGFFLTPMHTNINTAIYL